MNKKKILALCLILILGAIAIISGTLAYFTDTAAQTNTFTAGKVGISLDEAVVEPNANGDLVAKGTQRTADPQEYNLHPAQVITKDPTITVDSDSLDAYIAAKVTITGDIYDLIGVENYDTIDITALADGGLVSAASQSRSDWNGLSRVFETDECVIYQEADKAGQTWTLYVFVKEAQSANDTITLFETLTIPSTWDNDKMAKINGTEIVVNAYASQTAGFSDEVGAECFTAMTTAFAEDFDF